MREKIEQKLFTTNSNSDDYENDLYWALRCFNDALVAYNAEGWTCSQYLIVKDEVDDYLVSALFTRTGSNIDGKN